MDADEPDRPEVIQAADLLLSSFQAHLWVLAQAIPRAKGAMALAAGTCEVWGCWWGGPLAWAGVQEPCLVRRKARSKGLQRSALSALTSLIITQMREEAAHYGN